MKLYIKLFVILLISNTVLAQEPPVLSTTSLINPDEDINFGNNGNYAMDTANERDQYVGTWEYNQNGILFQVKIEKKDKYLNQVPSGPMSFYTYADVVTFKYKLVKNGVTIYNNINQIGFPSSIRIPTAIKKSINDYLHGQYRDVVEPVVGRVNITRLNTTPAKIFFDLNLGTYYFTDPNYNPDPNTPLFAIPTGGFEMVKIN